MSKLAQHQKLAAEVDYQMQAKYLLQQFMRQRSV
jgi:hypothetical protein